MKPAYTYGVGLRQPVAIAPTGDADTDRALLALLDDRRFFRQQVGAILGPLHDLAASLVPMQDGETVLLLPGQYDIRSPVVVNKRVRIVAHGAVFKGTGTLLQLDAMDIEVHGLQLWRTDTAVGGAAAIINADSCKMAECTVRSASTWGIYVELGADYVCVQCCKFLQDSGHVAGDADVYFANGATFGVVCGTMWSRTAATFALDYRGIDAMSQAANGAAPLINVR